MIIQVDSSLSLFEWGTLSMTEDLPIQQDGFIGLDLLNQESTLTLKRKFYKEQDLAFTVEALFFKETNLGELEGWREYDKTEGSLLTRWKTRLQVTSNYFKSTFKGIWNTVLSGKWKEFFAQREKDRRFLGLSQDIIALTKEYKLHKVNWDGLTTIQTADVFKLINLRFHKEKHDFYGSLNGHVMTWRPIIFYLKSINRLDELPEGLNEDYEFDFASETGEDDRHELTYPLTNEINVQKKFVKSCNIHKNFDPTESDRFFYLSCYTNDESCPILVAKVSAFTLEIVPMKLRELRKIMAVIDDIFESGSIHHNKRKIPFPFDTLHPDEQKKVEDMNPYKKMYMRVKSRSKTIEMIKNEKSLWSLQLDPKAEFIKTIRNLKDIGVSNQTNQVNGSLVLQKFDNANIVMFIVTEPSETPKRFDGNLYIVDAPTGKLLRRITLAALEKREVQNFKFSVNYFIENGIYFVTFQLRIDGPLRLHSIQIFRREIRQDIIGIIKDYFKGVSSLPQLDFFAEEEPFIVLDRAFRLPPDSMIIGRSLTRANVSEKHFLVSRPSGQVFALPISMVSPQRLSPAQLKTRKARMEDSYSTIPKKERHLLYMKEEYPPYKNSRITFPAQASLTKDLQRELVNSSFSGPTLLESTSLLLFAGNDWTAVPFAGDGRFDAISSSFDKTLLILGFFVMIGLVFALSLYERKNLATARFNE